jgi:hypothetical protein
MAKPTIFLTTQSGQRSLEIGVGVGASSKTWGKGDFGSRTMNSGPPFVGVERYFTIGEDLQGVKLQIHLFHHFKLLARYWAVIEGTSKLVQ